MFFAIGLDEACEKVLRLTRVAGDYQLLRSRTEQWFELRGISRTCRVHQSVHRFHWRGESFLPADCLRNQWRSGHKIEKACDKKK
jgi:hypothetical protein